MMALNDKIGAENIGQFCYTTPIEVDGENDLVSNTTIGKMFYSEKAAEAHQWILDGKVPFEDIPSLLRVYKCGNVSKPDNMLE